jgi:hypothetical protein
MLQQLWSGFVWCLTEFCSWQEQRFSLLCIIQASPETYPALCLLGGFSPGIQRIQDDALWDSHRLCWGSHNASRTLLVLDLYLRGPEDDSVRVETCHSKWHFIHVIKLMCLTDTIHSLSCIPHILAVTANYSLAVIHHPGITHTAYLIASINIIYKNWKKIFKQKL